MTNQNLFETIERLTGFTPLESDMDEIIDAYYKDNPNQSKHKQALLEIENDMERWHHARDEDGETLQKINDILVGVGMLQWFNKNDNE